MIFGPKLVEKILAGETEAARIIESGYVGSVRRYRARWQEENRAAWGEYHQGQAEPDRAILKSLIAHHEEQAAKLMDLNRKEQHAGHLHKARGEPLEKGTAPPSRTPRPSSS